MRILLFVICFFLLAIPSYPQRRCKVEVSFLENFHERRIPKRKGHRDNRYPHKVTYFFDVRFREVGHFIEALVKLQRANGMLRDFEEANIPRHRLGFDTETDDEPRRFISRYLRSEVKQGIIIRYDRLGNIVDETSLSNDSPFFDDSLRVAYKDDDHWLQSKLRYVKYDLASTVSAIISIQHYTDMHKKDTLVVQKDLQNIQKDTSIGVFYGQRIFGPPRLVYEDVRINLQDKLHTDTLIVTSRTDSGYTALQKKRKQENIFMVMLGTDVEFSTLTEKTVSFSTDKRLLLKKYSSVVTERSTSYGERLYKTSVVTIQVKWE